MQGFLLFPELNKTYTTGTFHASILHNHNIYNCTRPDIDLVQSISRKKNKIDFQLFQKRKEEYAGQGVIELRRRK